MAKILIVDDEEIARMTLAEILRLEGYTIKAVSNGEQAVESLKNDAFDVMILDLRMNGMSGIDVLNALADSQPNLAVIIMTAYGSFETAVQAIHYQVQDYLLKPVSPAQILESIQRALTKKRIGIAKVAEKQAEYYGQYEMLPGGAILTWDKRQISWETGSISLTPTEAKLLRILFDRRNQMVLHTELVFQIQGYRLGTEESAKILRPVVSRLRRKLSGMPGWSDWIKNIRGAGYVLELGKPLTVGISS